MSLKVIIFLSSLTCLCSGAFVKPWHVHNDLGVNEIWETFKHKFDKSYSSEEESFRQKIWNSNVQYIQRHNLEYDLGYHTYTLGVNEYADLTPQEYSKFLLGFRPQPHNRTFEDAEIYPYRRLEVSPTTLDWREHGYVTEVKNQGQCGSCWAFSSTGSLEGQHFRLTGRLPSLSEQNLVDCCGKYGNAGCNGGWMMNAFKYVEYNGGIDTEYSYPYEAKDDSCRYKAKDSGADDKGYVMVTKGDEEALHAAVTEVGPVSVAIDAAHRSFQLYSSGVYIEPNCTSQTDHAVLVVGYGVENGQDYWLVKNSWGTSWGMDGYIKMARNRNNQCAIADFACFPKM